jgi:hypothetical protein
MSLTCLLLPQLASEMRVAGLIDTYFEQPHPVLAPILLMTQVGCYRAVSISPYAGVSVQELRQTHWRCTGTPELTDTVKRMLVCVLEGSMALHELVSVCTMRGWLLKEAFNAGLPQRDSQTAM